MKKYLILALLLLVGTVIESIAGLPKKVEPTTTPRGDLLWSYGSSVRRAWNYMGTNAWGHDQYQCDNSGNECGQYDWVSEVSGIVFSNPDNETQCLNEFQSYLENNYPEYLNPNYGWNKSREEAAKINIILPATPPNPGVIEIFVFPFGN